MGQGSLSALCRFSSIFGTFLTKCSPSESLVFSAMQYDYIQSEKTKNPCVYELQPKIGNHVK